MMVCHFTNKMFNIDETDFVKDIQIVLLILYMSHVMRKPVFRASDQFRWVVKPQKMARGLKSWIYEVEELYYLCSENKGADQLRGYRTADLHLCFRICKMQVFS